MTDFQLLIDLHRSSHRQGPGGESQSLQALDLAGVDRHASLKVADIGCGTGAATLTLARALNHAHITAVDFFPEFLDELNSRAQQLHLSDKIDTLNCSMDTLPFAEATFDLIWSEGAIYNMGFEAGVCAWRRFLKPGGKMVLSEITWLTDCRPQELTSHWQQAYPEIDTAAAKFAVLERCGFSPIGYFALPSNCWLENYYDPLQANLPAFVQRHAQNPQAEAIAKAEAQEIALYKKFQAYYSYGFYIATRTS